MAELRRLETTEPTAMTVVAVVLTLAAADVGGERAGSSVVRVGTVDETAHVLTTLLVFWALGRRACRRFLLPALAASVGIDADHIPALLGQDFLTEGTPRPYTHSLLTICGPLLAALTWRRRRDPLLGIAAGLAIHFVRDLAHPRNGVALLWPVSHRSFSIPRAWYLALTGAVALIAGMRAAIRKRPVAGARRQPEAQLPGSVPATSR